jgi:hypothetical protein
MSLNSVDPFACRSRAENSRNVIGARIAKRCGVEAPVVATTNQSADRESEDAEQYGGDDARAELHRKMGHTVSTSVDVYLHLLISSFL